MLKVKSEKLLIIAAVVWLLAGINILRLGVIAITETELVAALLAVGVVVTFLLFHMMFAWESSRTAFVLMAMNPLARSLSSM